MLTLAVAPAVVAPDAGLTPLEAAVERLRHAALRRIIDGGGSQAPIFAAVQGLRACATSASQEKTCSVAVGWAFAWHGATPSCWV